MRKRRPCCREAISDIGGRNDMRRVGTMPARGRGQIMYASFRATISVARPGIASVPMRLADRKYGELPSLSAGRFPHDRASDPQAN
jgi:hypothetical protein